MGDEYGEKSERVRRIEEWRTWSERTVLTWRGKMKGRKE